MTSQLRIQTFIEQPSSEYFHSYISINGGVYRVCSKHDKYTENKGVSVCECEPAGIALKTAFGFVHIRVKFCFDF